MEFDVHLEFIVYIDFCHCVRLVDLLRPVRVRGSEQGWSIYFFNPINLQRRKRCISA